jgi:hypothetical protein
MHPSRLALLLSLCLAPAAASGATEVFSVDAEASRVRIHLGRAGLLGFLGHDHEIEAPIAEGRVEIVDGDPARSLVDVRWDAPALAVVPGTEPEEDVPEVEERMRGANVLDVGRHPRIRLWSFEIDVVSAAPGGESWDLRVHAGIEIKGARYRIALPVKVERDGDALLATGEVPLRLRAIGVEPPAVAGVVKVGNDFTISYEIRARRADPPPLVILSDSGERVERRISPDSRRR